MVSLPGWLKSLFQRPSADAGSTISPPVGEDASAALAALRDEVEAVRTVALDQAVLVEELERKADMVPVLQDEVRSLHKRVEKGEGRLDRAKHSLLLRRDDLEATHASADSAAFKAKIAARREEVTHLIDVLNGVDA